MKTEIAREPGLFIAFDSEEQGLCALPYRDLITITLVPAAKEIAAAQTLRFDFSGRIAEVHGNDLEPLFAAACDCRLKGVGVGGEGQSLVEGIVFSG